MLAQISKTVVIPGFSSGTYKGCILIAGDMAAKKVGTSYQVYVVAGCKKPFASVGPANYIFMYIYSPSTGKLSGQSPPPPFPPPSPALTLPPLPPRRSSSSLTHCNN